MPVYLWSWLTAWRQQPGALLSALLAVAMGVALALGIHLVNQSALHQFGQAINTVNGRADAQLASATGPLPDKWLQQVEPLDTVRAASPVIDTQVVVEPVAGSTTERVAGLRIVGLDVFRAARVTPGLLPVPFENSQRGAQNPLFGDNSLFLSDAAMQTLQLQPGESVTVRSNGKPVTLRVVGTVPGASEQMLGVMDIGTAQWRLGWLDHVSRIDIRLAQGATLPEFESAIGTLPDAGSVQWTLQTPQLASQQMSNLSRAYRVNLNVLALVALFTGGFIVYATMTLVARRLAPSLAMFHVLGGAPGLPTRILGGLSLLIGVAGALLGVLMGVLLAWMLLGLVGADLGGGYFSNSGSALVLPASSLAGFFLLGVLACLAGALTPAWQIRRLSPAQTLRSGAASSGHWNLPLPWPIGLLAAGFVLQSLPPVNGLPITSYLAIACWLFAGVALTGPISTWLLRIAGHGNRFARLSPAAWLANERLTSPQASTVAALAGVVASFALVSAMAIMVHSFRESVSNWLDVVLPADLYLQVPVSGAAAALSDTHIAQISQLAGVRSVRAARQLKQPGSTTGQSVVLMARELDAERPVEQQLPVSGAVLSNDQRDDRCIAVYPSEPAARRLAIQPGQRISVPVPVQSSITAPCFQAVATWRDYARQQGSLLISLSDYRRLSGDNSVSDLAIQLDAGAPPTRVMSEIRRTLNMGSNLRLREASDIRAISLEIFDRSFAVTYALEAVALIVGLFGVATTYAGEALSRMREFGMLRHLGVTRREIMRTFAWESGLSVAFGVGWGALLGAAIAQVLIHRVNPQSFHWTMQTHWPVASLIGAGSVLLVLGVLTATTAARRSAGTGPVAAVRSDW